MPNHNIAIVVSEFNSSITEQLLEGAVSRLQEHEVEEENISITYVPGAIEIPLAAKLLAESEKFSAIICLGAVIRGETSHYDYVCNQVSEGCQQVMMEFSIPVIFGVLTTENEEQAEDRVGGEHGHKGIESADAAIQMIEVVQALKKL